MGNELDLVLAVVHEALIKTRKELRALHEDVGLLNIIEHARQFRDVGVAGQVKPVVEVVVLLVTPDSGRDVSVRGLAETEAKTLFHTATKVLLGAGKQLVDALDAALEGVALVAGLEREVPGGNDANILRLLKIGGGETDECLVEFR